MAMLNSDGRSVRLDTDHAVQELMSAAVARINSAIQLEFRDRHVCLSGVAESWHEKQQAQESLRALSGQYTIRNEIRVPVWA